MPAIIVKDYSWRQTDENIIIHVPVFGNARRIDVFAINNYLKASYSPYILEIFLWDMIIEEKSECVVSDNQFVLTLKKQNFGITWPSLTSEDLSKEDMRNIRQKALQDFEVIAKNQAVARSEKRDKLQKEAVKQQIQLDSSIINKIESIRDSHRREAMSDLEDWKNQHSKAFMIKEKGELQDNRKAYKAPVRWFKDNKEDEVKKQSMLEESPDKTKSAEKLQEENTNEISSESGNNSSTSCSDDSQSDYEDSNKLKERKRRKELENRRKGSVIDKALKCRRYLQIDPLDSSKSVPLPRSSGNINVTFSDRVFPTPARESYHLQEQEWLEKQAEARRQSGFVAEDLRPEEQDPLWLKDKGDEFYKAGNYLGAISAYTHGLKLSNKMVSLYVNRSAAQYSIGNYQRCIEDSSTALELMTPQCEANRELRAKCHARRGAALCKMSSPQHGIPELEAALRLSPGNDSIKQDLSAAKKYFEIKD